MIITNSDLSEIWSSSNDMVINKWNDGFLFYAWLYSNGSNNVEDNEMSSLDKLLFRLDGMVDMLEIDLKYPDEINALEYMRNVKYGLNHILHMYRDGEDYYLHQ